MTKMKYIKMLTLSAIVGVSLFSINTSYAADVYVGADYSVTNYDMKNTGENDFGAVGGHVGVQLTDNVALEAGVSEALSEVTVGDETDIRQYSVEAIGSYPIYGPLDVLGTAGVQYSELERELGPDENAFGAVVGTGLQFNVTDNVNIRGLVKYDFTEFDTLQNDGAVKSTVGVNYQF